MGYLADMPVLERKANSVLDQAPDFLKSLDYKKIAKAAAFAGAGLLALKSLKWLVYGKAAAIAYDKAKAVMNSKQAG